MMISRRFFFFVGADNQNGKKRMITAKKNKHLGLATGLLGKRHVAHTNFWGSCI
jgi:hypothetical protein